MYGSVAFTTHMLHRKLNDDHISHVMVTMSNVVLESELMVVMSDSYLLDFYDFFICLENRHH